MALCSPPILSLLLLLLLLIYFTLCASSTIPLGSTLYASTPNQSWPSRSATFSVSFIPTPSPESFEAAVTFFGGITIWSAGAVDSGGSLRLLPTGSLRLLNGSGAIVWDSATDRLGVASASLEDSGELVLLNNRSVAVWSSFDHPTDTIVPSQNFTLGKILRSGPYSFQLQNNGNLTLMWNDTITYWNHGLNSSIDTNLSAPSLGLQSNGAVLIFDSTLPGGAATLYSSDYGDESARLRFLKLDDDGNLRIYSYDRNSGTNTSKSAAIGDQCLVYGYCGNFGICSYDDDSNPVCGCPSRNFEPIDVNDRRKGCKRKVELNACLGSQTMLVLSHTNLLTYPPESSSLLFYAGVDPCRSNCLASGACIASIAMSDGSGICWQKQTGFISGYQNPSLPGTSFVKVCGPVLPNPSPKSNKSDKYSTVRIWIIAVVIIATLLCLITLEAGLWWWCCKNSTKFGGLSTQYTLLEYASGAPVQFSYKELRRCTKGFKEKLGSGGFGAVYRGVLTNRTVVAVKQLEGIDQGEKQFRMEVATISSTHHLNLVRLIGFCSEGRHRLLVYEFMKNGSLDNFLFMTDSPSSGKLLTWEYRFNIALGTAKGIAYLHEECRDCIVHCDIKPENILLDENYSARVSDFGLAKLVNPKDNRYRTLSSIRGTRGYLAPEWIANLPITSKSDVYSFGMVLLEIVSGRRNFEVSPEMNMKKFSLWAYEEFEKGNAQGILDRKLGADQSVDMEQVIRVIQVSFWCTQEQPSQRPTMGKVVQMLEGITNINKPPAPAALGEGSVSGSSINVSGYVSNPSTFAASAPHPSSASSLPRLSSSASRKNGEGTTSLLKQS